MKNSKLLLGFRVADASSAFVEASGERQDDRPSVFSSSLSSLSPILFESAVVVAAAAAGANVFIDLFRYCDTDVLKSILFVMLVG